MRSRLAALAALAALVALASPAGADDAPAPGHATPAAPEAVRSLHDLAPDQRARARGLFTQVMCACPSENWSRTLVNCPDACATPQKTEIATLVAAGRSDTEIIEAQRAKHGGMVIAAPDASGVGLGLYVLPFAGLVLGAALVAFVLLRWRAARLDASPQPAAKLGAGEVALVERELTEVE